MNFHGGWLAALPVPSRVVRQELLFRFEPVLFR